MTNHYVDFRNADVILNMGGNVAENHPVSFKWVQAAKDKGAIFIHADPRFTRTSSKADIFVRLRSGTDIAFLGGMIKYILDNNLYDEFYVKNYTNASFMVNPKYSFDDGLFSGYNPGKRAYDKSTWALEKDDQGIPKRDMTLQDPRCAFQLLKKHYSRYTTSATTLPTIPSIFLSILSKVSPVVCQYSKKLPLDEFGSRWMISIAGIFRISLMK